MNQRRDMIQRLLQALAFWGVWTLGTGITVLIASATSGNWKALF